MINVVQFYLIGHKEYESVAHIAAKINRPANDIGVE